MKMLLRYRRIDHVIQFADPLFFPTLPSFVFRSIIGKELKRLTCIFRGRPCKDCGLKYTCAYSWIFESPLETQPEVLEGRDRGSHPFLLSTDAQPRQQVQTITLTLTVMGEAIEYYPYLFYALKRAGEMGVLKERIPFEVVDVFCEGQSILSGTDSIHPTWGIHHWAIQHKQTDPITKPDQKKSKEDHSPIETSIQVHLETPLRLRVEGKYTSLFTSEQFFSSLYRRAVILCSLYGEPVQSTDALSGMDQVQTPPALSNGIRIVSRDLRWLDLIYYSSRQKKALRLGGVIGDFILNGYLKPLERSLLLFGELFHAGKNTTFGLGRFRLEER